MKKFQDLLVDDSQNQYGLKYSPIVNPSRLSKNTIKNDHEKNIQKVDIYVKSINKKSFKIKVQKPCEIKSLKEILKLKNQIIPQDQILYLNGRQISDYFSITFNQSQILHVSSRKSIVNQNQNVSVHAQISVPIQISHNGQKFNFSFKGGDKVNKLQESINQRTTICNPQNSFTINFVESGRILDKDKSFHENMLTNQCTIVCLFSQNFVQTKFLNQFCQTIPKKIGTQSNEYKLQIHPQKASQEDKNDEDSFQSLKFKKFPFKTKNFLVEKPKNSIYTRIQRKSQLTPHSSDSLKPTIMQKRRSEAASMQFGGSGFKKKRVYTEDQKSEDSHLITKIVVRKSKKQIQKLLSDSNFLPENIHEEQEKKSFVSSSSSQENGKQYIPIRQQKQYRPCPIIPQRKMPQSQKMKINFELQKLFGLQPKSVSPTKNEPQSSNTETQGKQQNETGRVRLINKNSNMRRSISAKQSTIKALKDRKSNRYAEQKMYQGD